MPQKGKATFSKLRANFGYEQAAIVFNKVTGQEFLDRYGDSLTLDSEGVPTYQSIMQNPAVKKFIGDDAIANSLSKNMPHYEDNVTNTTILVNKAIELNNNPENSDFVAIVDHDDKGKLTITFLPKTDENIEIAESQANIQKLNEKVAELLAPAGVTLSFLSTVETAAGRVGITNFNHAKDIANGFTGLIQIANNMEGTTAMSEEFAHLLVGMYQDSPLIKRAIAFFSNEANARAILGDEYDSVSEFYNGDERMIAEEAAGQALREQLLNNIKAPVAKGNLFERAANFIKRLFKGLNPGYYQDSIDNINTELSNFARAILNQDKKFTKEDIAKAQRNAVFNALSKKAQAQVDVLKTAIENAFKASYLQENLDEKAEGERTEKSKARVVAEKINKEVRKKLNQEETMAAISAYLDIAIADVDGLFSHLQGLDNMSTADKFTILRNALFIIQSYAPTLDELHRVTTAEYLEDEGIAAQEFMYEDSENTLAPFEAVDEVEPVDTSGMSAEQVANRITSDSEDFELSEDEEYYINRKTGERFKRVTSVIDATRDADEPFDKESPWYVPSTNVGTGVDEFVRDFIAGRIVRDGKTFKVDGKDLDEVYPNATAKSLNILAHQLENFLTAQSDQGITLIPRDVTVNGTISTVDEKHNTHIINVAGTLDLLGYDGEGNWFIYDMKTHRGDKISDSKKIKYAKQLSLYKKFLEDKYGINIKSLSIIPIHVEYDTPLGVGKGTTNYTVDEEKPEGYNGRKGNQLYKDGEEFRGARPKLEDTIDLTERSVEVEYKKISGDPTGGLGSGALAVTEGVKALQGLYSSFITRFSEVALPYFVEFLKPFIGENIKVVEGRQRWTDRGVDREVSIEQALLNAPADVTFMQRMFNSIADNPNALLQIFDKVVKRAKDEKRLKVIEKAQEIVALGKEYELKGVTDYSRFFESDRQNYVNHLVINGKDLSYDKSAYEEAKANFTKSLDSIYGEHPEIGTDDYNKKRDALKRWMEGDKDTEGHLIKVKDENNKELVIPNPKFFPSKYNSLTATEKEFFEKWLKIKAELDDLIGPGHTYLTNSIKIRKNSIERLSGVFSGNVITEFVESTKAKVMKSFDDDLNYASGIQGFTGEEVMKLPLYYINAKSNDISTDMIGTLIAYAEMAYNYDAMNQIVNPLEIGKYLAYEKLGIQDTRGTRPLMEKFSVGGKTITNPIKVPVASSQLAAALQDFFESKIYGRYLKDAGEINGVDVNKAANILLKIGSTVQLGFNALAWMANATTGAAMQNIEAAAGEFFNAKELFNADKEFFKAMGGFVGDIGQRVQTSKLHLFDEMFDVRQNFKTNNNNRDFNNRNLLTRVFGPGIQYIGQDAGDHWLYNRTAIAVALRYKMRDSHGNSISLWDALEVVPVREGHPELGTKIKLKDGVTKADGSEFTSKDISDLSGRMRYINQHLFGIYNDEDSVGARRTVWGRFLLQYRDWIPSQFRYRFGARTTNLEKGGDVEGYYRTTARFITQVWSDLRNGNANITQLWNELDEYDRRNVVRAGTEISQFIALCAIVAILNGGDDKDRKNRPWAVRALRYLATREKTELGALVPFSMPREMIQIAKSPFANTSIISDIWNLSLLLNPMNYTDEIQSGDYKGHSTAYRAFMRSPLTVWYRTLKRTAHPEKSEQFYNQNR